MSFPNCYSSSNFVENTKFRVNDVHESSTNCNSAASHTQQDEVNDERAVQLSRIKEKQSLRRDEEEQENQSITPLEQSLPPNGGHIAWTQVLCGFLLFVNTFGILTSFGVFQTFYESSASPFQQTSSNISWIGSVQACLLQLMGLFVGPIYDKGYLRCLLAGGGFLVVFGLMMLSLATEYWEVILAQGLCVGLGMGCLYLPSVSILPSYFSTRLGLAIGLASSGSAVGGVIFPIVLQRLFEELGFAWAVRAVGFIALVGLSLPIALMRMRVRPAATRALIDWSAFSDVPFLCFAVGTSICFMGVFTFQSYFSFYAEQQRITSIAFAFNLVSIYNGVSALGRIIPNAVSDRVGQFNILVPSALLCSAIFLCTIAVHSEGPMIGVVVLAGFFLGTLTALPPVCFAALTKDKSKIGSRIGTGFSIIAPGILIGSPAAGAILQRSDVLNWAGLFSFAGGAVFVAGVLYTGLKFARSGPRLFIRV